MKINSLIEENFSYSVPFSLQLNSLKQPKRPKVQSSTIEPNNNNYESYHVKSPSNAYQTASIPQTTYPATNYHQLPQQTLSHTETLQTLNTPHITYTDTFSSQTYFDPNEIFQLNNPIKSEYNTPTTQNYPQTTQSKSISPPTVLDMESGRIHHNHHSSVVSHMPTMQHATTYDYNSNSCDDAASLVSNSSASVFDDGYYSVQGYDINQYSPSYSVEYGQQFGNATGEMNTLIDYYVNDGMGNDALTPQDYEMSVYPMLGTQHSGSEEFINYDPTITGFY